MLGYCNSIIKGTGHYLPENIVKNSHFLNYDFYNEKGQRYDIGNKEIIDKFQAITEIEERRYAPKELLTSDIAAIAGERALEDSGIGKEELDYIIVAHNFADVTPSKMEIDIMPSISAKVKNKMDIKNPSCIPYDMNFGCPGWIQSLIMAHQFIRAKLAKNILVIGSDTLSRLVDVYDRNCMIFADGSAAVVLSSEEQDTKKGVLGYDVVCNNNEELHYLKLGKSLNPTEDKETFIRMQGRRIYEYALNNVPKTIKSVLDDLELHIDDISKLLIHQANAKMDHAILERLIKIYERKEIPKDFMPMTIQKFGNSSVATVPTMLDIILKGQFKPHQIHSGDIILFASVGAGMNINVVVYKV